MKRTFIHNAYSSFVMWFDYELLSKGQAYTNSSGVLYPMTDKDFPNSYIFASPFKQWVYDSSISGANIPSGVYVNGSFVARGVSGLKIDYQNGRVLFDSPVSGQVSGNYAVKDFNIYTTSKSDAELIYETRYQINPTFAQIQTGANPDNVVAPCVFAKIKGTSNKPYALGGLDLSTVNIRCVIMAAKEYELNGVGGIFSDARNKSIPYIDGYTPLNRYGDLKSGSFNYTGTAVQYFNPSTAIFIENSSFMRFSQQGLSQTLPDIDVGFIDVSLVAARYPRLN